MVLLCTPAFPVKSVFAGQFLSQSILILFSIALARLALTVSPAYIGLAGVVPITLGALKLLERNNHQYKEVPDRPSNPPGKTSYHTLGSTTVLSLSNGGII